MRNLIWRCCLQHRGLSEEWNRHLQWSLMGKWTTLKSVDSESRVISMHCVLDGIMAWCTLARLLNCVGGEYGEAGTLLIMWTPEELWQDFKSWVYLLIWIMLFSVKKKGLLSCWLYLVLNNFKWMLCFWWLLFKFLWGCLCDLERNTHHVKSFPAQTWLELALCGRTLSRDCVSPIAGSPMPGPA